MAVDVAGTAVLSQLLTGMGGVGKTQLAADYARTAWNDTSTNGGLDVLVWVAASTRSSIVTGYAQAGIELCRAAPGDEETAARSFLAWLTPKAGGKPCRWLIILDDVTDPDDLKRLWPPASPHGRTLVTTRRRDAALTADCRRTVEVGLFTRTESVAYLASTLAEHGRVEPDDQLAALAKDLGDLPLALAQAAAYIIDSGDHVAAYRALLADRTTTLADAAPDVLPDEQALPLDAAWSLSIDRADTLRPPGLARPMLQLSALLDANGIPHDVLTSSPVLTYLAAYRTRSGADARQEPKTILARDAVLALRSLHRLSLVDHAPETPSQAVRVHQLIQRAVRDTLPHQHEQLARIAADALLAVWPDVERDTSLVQTLRTNITALTKHAGNALYESGVHAVLYRAGGSLGETGQVTAARAYFRRLADDALHHLGPDHPDTLTAEHELARWQAEAGDMAGAASAFAELLEHRRRLLGEDHPDTLATRHNLADRRGEAGDAAGAAAAFAELLPHMVRVLGEDHPDTLDALGSLAGWQGVAGDAAGAAAAFAELLPHMVRVLGEDHPQSLTVRHNLAHWRGWAGDVAGAVTAFTELLDDRVRVLGPDHPDILSTRAGLAGWRGTAGDAAGAADALVELLDDRVRVLGPDHPRTLITRRTLADFRGRAGDATGAAAAFAELLPHMVRVLGEDHPDTLATRYNLADRRGWAGDVAGAVTAFTELLDDRVRVLGPDHPDTFATRHSLASWRGKAGDAVGAVTAFTELLDDRVRVLGPDHLDTFATRHSLAYWRGKAGDVAGAVTACMELLDDRVRVLGSDHPDILSTRAALAGWRGTAGDAAGAADAAAELLDDRVRVSGPDHSDTFATRHSLAYWRGKAGDAVGAVTTFTELLDDRVRVLGPDHSDTFATRHSLAYWLVHYGRQLAKTGKSRPSALEGRINVPDLNSSDGSSWLAQALACFQEALELTDSDKDPQFYGVILHDIADTHRGTHDLRAAATYYRQALEHKQRADDSPGSLLTTMLALADCLLDGSELAESQAVLDQTAELLLHKAEAMGPARQAVYLHSLGQSYERLGDHGHEGAHTTALNMYQEALKLIDVEKDPRSYAAVLRRIGDIRKAQGNLHDAHSAYSRAVELLRQDDGTQQQGLVSTLIDLGRICQEISVHEE